MILCKNCKFWSKIIPGSERTIDEVCIIEPIDQDTNEKMKIDFEMRYCTSDKIVFYERPPESNMLTLLDASQYRAKMITGEDFGCVNGIKEKKFQIDQIH